MRQKDFPAINVNYFNKIVVALKVFWINILIDISKKIPVTKW